jgi:hypothetical protein
VCTLSPNVGDNAYIYKIVNNGSEGNSYEKGYGVGTLSRTLGSGMHHYIYSSNTWYELTYGFDVSYIGG